MLYAIRKVQENQAGLKVNGTHQLLAYAGDVNLLGDNIDSTNKNTQTLIDASKEVGLEVNVEKTKYMLVSRDQNAGQNREIKIGNISFENVSMLQCGKIVLLTVRFLDVVKLNTTLSLLILCKLSFPIVGMKLSYLPILALNLGNSLNTNSSSS
jgi:hypothetical protein